MADTTTTNTETTECTGGCCAGSEDCNISDCAKKLLTGYAETKGLTLENICDTNPALCAFADYTVAKMKEKGACPDGSCGTNDEAPAGDTVDAA